MKWRPARTGVEPVYAFVSDCGTYSVCKIGINGSAVYEAWRTRAHRDGPHLVATNLDSADLARQICEADRDEA